VNDVIKGKLLESETPIDEQHEGAVCEFSRSGGGDFARDRF